METVLLFLKLAGIIVVILVMKLGARYIEGLLFGKSLSKTGGRDGRYQGNAVEKYKGNVESKIYITTKVEGYFYRRLESILGVDRYIICPKVRIADIISVQRKGWFTPYSIFNKLAQKHVDFLLLDRATLKIVCAIELDDYTHDTYKGREKDDFKDTMFAIANIPLFRTRNAEITAEEIQSWGI